MFNIKKAFVAATALGLSISAFSTNNTENQSNKLNTYLLGGLKWATTNTTSEYTKEANFTEQEYRLGANYRPWNNVPVSLGAYFSCNLGNDLKLSENTNSNLYKSATNSYGMDFGVDLTWYVPQSVVPVSNISPYFTLSYIPLTHYVREYEVTTINNQASSLDLKGTSSGWAAHIGTNIAINHQYAATVSYSYNNRTQDLAGNFENATNNSSNQTQAPVSDKRTYAAHGLMLGVNARL